MLLLLSSDTAIVTRLLSKTLEIRMYRKIIVPLVLFGCGTWSLVSREGQKLQVFKNTVLMKISGLRIIK
jgi:hypothetical protein